MYGRVSGLDSSPARPTSEVGCAPLAPLDCDHVANLVPPALITRLALLDDACNALHPSRVEWNLVSLCTMTWSVFAHVLPFHSDVTELHLLLHVVRRVCSSCPAAGSPVVTHMSFIFSLISLLVPHVQLQPWQRDMLAAAQPQIKSLLLQAGSAAAVAEDVGTSISATFRAATTMLQVRAVVQMLLSHAP